MKINELCKLSHKISKEKGWYNKGDRNIGELIALIHSELSEALEEARESADVLELSHIFYSSKNNPKARIGKADIEHNKPEGFAVEIADAVIRIADLCGYLGIDLEKSIKTKIAYNKTRKNRHGGKAF
jgi:NTP pyrophosphatase (non-canonical NTP hydrolase)